MAIKIFEITNIANVKKILEADDKKDPNTGKWVVNEFKTQGYKMQDAASLGISKEASYLYIKAGDEFFKKHEKTILDAGAKELKGAELKEVQHKFESAEDSSIAGMGAIFG
ncbi:MAG: hypothetical protein V1839_04015 [archaeon]